MGAAVLMPRRSQYSTTITSSMFARLRRSAVAAAASSSFTSGGTRRVRVAVFDCVRVTATSLLQHMCCVVTAKCSQSTGVRNSVQPAVERSDRRKGPTTWASTSWPVPVIGAVERLSRPLTRRAAPPSRPVPPVAKRRQTLISSRTSMRQWRKSMISLTFGHQLDNTRSE